MVWEERLEADVLDVVDAEPSQNGSGLERRIGRNGRLEEDESIRGFALDIPIGRRGR